GKEVVVHPDGSTTEIAPNQSKITKDADGNLTKVELPNGNQWIKDGDKWVQHDAGGNKTGLEAEDIKPESNGDITFKFNKDFGGKEVVIYPDGSTTAIMPGGDKPVLAAME